MKSLPNWHGQLLKGSDILCGHPFPITRALSIIKYRQCEVCGRGRVKGVKYPYIVYCHDECMENQLTNSFYLDHTTLQLLYAAGAPKFIKSGYNPHARRGYRDWTMTMYWQNMVSSSG